jgi:hypothetical protein
MANLTYTVADFVAFTKIKSAEVNSKFQSIKDHFNLSNQINRAAIENGTADHVVINSGTGSLSSEANLATTRGGTGTDIDTSGLILKELATPSTPTSGFGKVYFKADGFLYQLNDNGTETKVGAGSGGGGTNYVLNPDFESTTGNWSVYNDTATFLNTDVDTGTETITITAHGLLNDDKVIFTSTGTLPAGLSTATTYFVINKTTDTFQVSATLGGTAVDMTDGGTGTHTMRPLQPINATGGTGNITLTRTTSSPLANTASGLITKDSATRAGEGISTDLGLAVGDYNINREDLAHILQVEFSYSIASGSFVPGSDSALGDLSVHIVDITSGERIPLTPFKLAGAVIGTKYKYMGVFQTHSANRSYRLAIHESNASGSAYTLLIDSVSVGPQVKELGAPVTDWVPYTPTITTSSGTITNYVLTSNYRRVGDSLEVTGRLLFTGSAGTWNVPYVTLPPGLAIDSSKVNSTTSDGGLLGISSALDSGSQVFNGNNCYYSDTLRVRVGVFGGTVPFSFGINDEITWTFIVPITGWSSSLVMSSDADTRVVAARYFMATAATPTAFTPILFDTFVFDTHAAYSTSTGYYTAPTSGIYRVSASIQAISSAQTSYLVAKNNTNAGYVGQTNTITNDLATGSVLVSLVSGDTIAIMQEGSNQLAGATTAFDIERLSGPEQIAANETVAMKYEATAGSVINSVPTASVYDIKIIDTHNAFNTSTYQYTIPAAGKYQIVARLYNGSSGLVPYILKNGAIVSQGSECSSTTNGINTDLVDCKAGDLITFSSSNTSVTSNATYLNSVSISRIGI